jgi:hypothetical protein
MTQEQAVQLVNILLTYFLTICFIHIIPHSQYSKCATFVKAFPTKTYIYFWLTPHQAYKKVLILLSPRIQYWGKSINRKVPWYITFPARYYFFQRQFKCFP